jgi:hypothetical protein
MVYKTAFWILIFLTVISAVLQIVGYDFLDVLIGLLIIDSIGFGAVVEFERKKSAKETKITKNMDQKIDSLETICKDILQKISVNSAVMELEEKLNRHKVEEKTSLDKIAEKTLELEKKINKFGVNLAEHLGLENQEDVSDYVYLESEED